MKYFKIHPLIQLLFDSQRNLSFRVEAAKIQLRQEKAILKETHGRFEQIVKQNFVNSAQSTFIKSNV